MRYMNEYDLFSAQRRYDPARVPNRAYLTQVIMALAEWANHNSDGWAYWPKPCRAAARAIELVESTAYPEYERRQREDATDAETMAAVRPIKAFLTRQGERPEAILPARQLAMALR
jgi:hypothetical protein